ncbi:MAG TPA: PhnD/SsuA/transferrin family substrate-binding protein [Candidatus Binatia bacterium]|nr:PhnD/SsuA/transferrin family substrate-binding protein [Candidatus Binatia bacterium]
MPELKIIYRSESHAPFWVVAEQAGIWEKNGLKVNTSPELGRERAVEALKNGHVDLISGNHHNLYARRAQNREDFVHLAQLGNRWTENHLIVSDAINSVQDLKGKQIAVDSKNSHAGLNVWLFLRQEGLDLDKGDYDLVETRVSTDKRCKGVLAGEFDAAFVDLPHNLRALRQGAREIVVRPMAMIRGVTLTTTMAYVQSHEREIRLLIRGTAEAVHFFLRQREKTQRIMRESSVLALQNDEEVSALYDSWASFLERKLYPTTEAINNVFALAVRLKPEIAHLNPLIMWDTHYLRELDDSGFIDDLYR